MKLYRLSPPDGIDHSDPQPQSEIRLYRTAVVALIAESLRIDRDGSFIGVWSNGEVGMDRVVFDQAYGNARLINLPDREAICQALYKCANDEELYFMWVRSQITCRSVYFIGDGKAYLCLVSGDPAPVTDSPMVQINECSRLLIDTDYIDGAWAVE